MTTYSESRAALDAALADALPRSGGDVRKQLKKLIRALAAADRERERCAAVGCGHTRAWHKDGLCVGDLLHCPCREFEEPKP